MYATCTFCHASLGANEMLERFPVGKRLAFDAEKGRLWVVCGACKQWNLSPLDERWEAIEDAERLYRETKLRVATDQVGLAKLKDGTQLIRIGRPLRPEFAAWRYGDRFVTRWRRYAVGTAIFGVGAYSLGPMLGLGFSMFPYYLVSWTRAALSRRRVVARLDDAAGPVAITNELLKEARLETSPAQPEGWQLSIPHLRKSTRVGGLVGSLDDGVSRLVISGPEAVRALRQVMPRVNESGGRQRVVSDAVKLIEEIGDVRQTFRRAATSVGRDAAGDPSRLLTTLEAPMRLALEMAAHEDIERRALEGELAALEESWKQAEEIAAIADSLTLPEWIADRLNRPIGG